MVVLVAVVQWRRSEGFGGGVLGFRRGRNVCFDFDKVDLMFSSSFVSNLGNYL